MTNVNPSISALLEQSAAIQSLSTWMSAGFRPSAALKIAGSRHGSCGAVLAALKGIIGAGEFDPLIREMRNRADIFLPFTPTLVKVGSMASNDHTRMIVTEILNLCSVFIQRIAERQAGGLPVDHALVNTAADFYGLVLLLEFDNPLPESLEIMSVASSPSNRAFFEKVFEHVATTEGNLTDAVKHTREVLNLPENNRCCDKFVIAAISNGEQDDILLLSLQALTNSLMWEALGVQVIDQSAHHNTE